MCTHVNSCKTSYVELRNRIETIYVHLLEKLTLKVTLNVILERFLFLLTSRCKGFAANRTQAARMLLKRANERESKGESRGGEQRK